MGSAVLLEGTAFQGLGSKPSGDCFCPGVQDEVVAAEIPRRWSGSSEPVTAAAAAALEHHSRPSVQGTAPDIAVGSPGSGCGNGLLQVDYLTTVAAAFCH